MKISGLPMPSITKRASVLERIKNLGRPEQVTWKTTNPDGTITKGGHYWKWPEIKFTQKGTELPNYVSQDGTSTAYYQPGNDLSKFKKITYLDSEGWFCERSFDKSGKNPDYDAFYSLGSQDNLLAVKDYEAGRIFNKVEDPRSISLYKILLDIKNWRL